jgi:hypothetical protein
MAEERTLGLVRAHDEVAEDPSKEELQRRLGEARDSISNTVTEIKETVANQVQAVKNTLDWREQFKKRPVAWSAGALGVGFCVGYCIANYAKGDERYRYDSAVDRLAEESRYYAAQPILGNSAAAATQAGMRAKQENGHDSGPGLFQKVASSHAFGRVRDEAGSLGDAVVQELSKTAKTVVIPALITSLRNFIGEHLPNVQKAPQDAREARSGYQPALERNAS